MSEKLLPETSVYDVPPSSLGVLPWMETVEIPSARSSLSRLFAELDVGGQTERYSFNENAERYFRKLEAASSNYFLAIAGFEEYLVDDLGPAETTVAIAVASDQEGDNIYTTLEQYAGQSVSSDFDIVLFLNKTKAGGDDRQTLAAIELFTKNYPDFPVKTFCHEFSEQMPIGYIKKMLHDTVALHHLRNESEDPVIILGDGDTRRIHPRYIQRILESFNDKSVDIVTGHLDWDHDAFLQFPELHFATRLYQLADYAIHSRDGRKVTPGAATAMRLGSYCEMEGTVDVARGEDVLHGLKIEAIRGDATSIVHPHPEAVLETSARRNVVAFQQGYAPNETWKLRSRAQDAMVRSYTADTNERRESVSLHELEGSMRKLAKRVIDVYDESFEVGLFQEALGELGVDATLKRSSCATITRFDASQALEARRDYMMKKSAADDLTLSTNTAGIPVPMLS